MLSFSELSNCKKKHKRKKTREEIAALTKCNYIVLGRGYDMNDILEDIDIFDQTQCFDYYFHRK